MWLPDANERKLLRKYTDVVRYRCKQSGNSPFEPINLTLSDLVSAFRPEAALDLRQEADLPPKKMCNRHKRYIDCIYHIFALNFVLQERDLIQSRPERISNFYSGDLTFKLTPSGYDLGYKYSKWWKCWHLWWLEYKDSFIWPIIGFFFGSLVTYIITRHN